MAIRFPCPFCKQPLEVDDHWAGQSVGCPFCERVVTAPEASTWSQSAITSARPAAPGTSFPGGATEGPSPADRPARSGAPWAFLWAISSGLVGLAGLFTWMNQVLIMVQAEVGPNPDQQELQEGLKTLMARGDAYAFSTTTVYLFLAGIVCGIVALTIGTRTILRPQRHRGLAIAACVIGMCCAFCQAILLLTAWASQAVPTTLPAEAAHSASLLAL